MHRKHDAELIENARAKLLLHFVEIGAPAGPRRGVEKTRFLVRTRNKVREREKEHSVRLPCVMLINVAAAIDLERKPFCDNHGLERL
jgi:hypothetical protein